MTGRVKGGIEGFTMPAIRRLDRLIIHLIKNSCLVNQETLDVIRIFVKNVIRDAVTYTEHSKRSKITAKDVAEALKLHNRTFHGLGG
ncbi:unnamed protein product [Diamesa tonsa]